MDNEQTHRNNDANDTGIGEGSSCSSPVVARAVVVVGGTGRLVLGSSEGADESSEAGCSIWAIGYSGGIKDSVTVYILRETRARLR